MKIMKIKGILMYIVCVVFIWCAVSSIKPYWDTYWLGQALEVTAVYGTKNSIEATRNFLDTKMKEEGRDFAGEDFTIEKDERNNVTISIKYSDEIRIFGVKLKTLEFSVEKTAFEVKEFF
jgi:hypothetical protein